MIYILKKIFIKLGKKFNKEMKQNLFVEIVKLNLSSMLIQKELLLLIPVIELIYIQKKFQK
jgi:hypothetical protein